MRITGASCLVLGLLTACNAVLHDDVTNKQVTSYSSMVMHNDFSVPESLGGGLTVQEPPKGWPFTDPTLQEMAHSHLASDQAPASSRQHQVVLKPHGQYHVASNQGAGHNQQQQSASSQSKQYHAASNQVSGNNQQQTASTQNKQYHVASNQGQGHNQQQQSASSQIKQYQLASNQGMGSNQQQSVASNQAPMQKRTRSNGVERAVETIHNGGQEDEDFSPVSFVHSERQKNLGARKAKGVPQMKHTSAILGQSSELRPGVLGPRQPHLELPQGQTTTPKKVVSTQKFQMFHGGPQPPSYQDDMKPMQVKFEDSLSTLPGHNAPNKAVTSHNFDLMHGGQFAGSQQTSFGQEDVKFGDSLPTTLHNTPKKVVSSQNFQLFHGGKFSGSQQTSFGQDDLKTIADKPLPMRKFKKKKAAKPQGQEPSAVNVGYTIGFVNHPEAQPKGPVHTNSQVGLSDGILTLTNDDIIVGKPAHIGATGATGQAASTQNHQIIHMIHNQQHEQGGVPDNQIPTVHHILHNQPLNTQQLSDIFSNNYEGNKVYSHVMPTQQDVDYQIQTVPDQQVLHQQGHRDANGHVMLVTQESPSSDTTYYSPQQYRWKNVNGVEVASSIPVTEEQNDDLPNPHHKPQPPPQRPPPPQQQQPQALALQQAPPPMANDEDDEQQYVYLPVLEHSPSQHSQQTIPTLSHHGQMVTYSPIVSGPSGSSSNFDHKKALTHSVGFDYSNAMIAMPHLQPVRGQHQNQQSFVIVEDGSGTKSQTQLNHEELNGDMDIKVEYVEVDQNAVTGATSQGGNQHGLTYELPKKTPGLPAEFPKGFNFGPMPVMNTNDQNNGQHLFLEQNGGSPNQPTFAQLFGNGNAGPQQQNFGQEGSGQTLTFGHELPVFPNYNFHGGKGVFKQPNILHLQNGGHNAGNQNFGGNINSNSISFGHPGGQPGHQGFPGHHSGRVMLSQGTFSGEGLPIAGLVEAGVPPFNDLKGPPMNMGGRPGGFRGGRVISPPRFVQNFQQGRGQFQQQGGRMPNQGVIFHQFMLNPQQLGQNQGPIQGRPVQFPMGAPQPPQQQPPPTMNGPPIVLSMNTLNHHHAVQNAIRQANQHKQNLRQNQQFHIDGAGVPSNHRPSFPRHPNMMFHRERQPLKPRENQQVIVQREKDKRHKHMQKQRNELAKYNSMLSVALFKPVGKVTSQYFIKNDVKSAEFPITSSFTLDLKPPKMK